MCVWCVYDVFHGSCLNSSASDMIFFYAVLSKTKRNARKNASISHDQKGIINGKWVSKYVNFDYSRLDCVTDDLHFMTHFTTHITTYITTGANVANDVLFRPWWTPETPGTHTLSHTHAHPFLHTCSLSSNSQAQKYTFIYSNYAHIWHVRSYWLCA